MAGRRDKGGEKDIVLERMHVLFAKAGERALGGDLAGADRCVSIARGLCMRYKVRVPREFKRLYCKHCYRFLLPSVSSRHRVDSTKRRVEVKCLSCGGLIYYPIAKGKGG